MVMYAKIHYEPAKGGAFAPPLPPLNPLLTLYGCAPSKAFSCSSLNVDGLTKGFSFS